MLAAWSGARKKLAYFESLEQETLAQLVKEQPGTEQELAQSVGYAVIEKKVVKVPVVGAGGGAGVVVEKANGKKRYLRVPELQLGLGWGGRAEKVILIFQDVEKLRNLAGGTWKAGIAAEAAAKAGDVGAAGGGGHGTAHEEGFYHLRADRCRRFRDRHDCRAAGAALFDRLGACPTLPSWRGEGGAARCEAADPEKPEAYSLEYVEDFFGRERRRWPRIVHRSRKVNVGQAPRTRRGTAGYSPARERSILLTPL